MKNTSRILPYALSQKLTEDDLQNVAAAGGTQLVTDVVTHSPSGGTDIRPGDIQYDV